MQNKDSKFILQQANQKIDFKEHLYKFYFEKLTDILHGFSRNRILSAVFITIYFAQVISLSFGSAFLTEYAFKVKALVGVDTQVVFENDQKGLQQIEGLIDLYNSDISVHYYVYKLLKYCRLYPILYDIFSQNQSHLQLAILILFISLNSLVLFHPLVKMGISYISLSYSYKINLRKEFLSPNENKNDYFEIDSFIYQLFSVFDYFVTMMYGLYRYILMIPNLVFSMNYLVQQDSSLGEQVIAGINLTFTILISFIVAVHDFDVSFIRKSEDSIEGQDFLSRRISFQSILNVTGDIVKCGILAFNFSVNQYFIICLISLVFSLMEYAEFSLSFIYLRHSTAKVNFLYLNILTFFNGIIILFGQTAISDDTSCILVIILSIPIVSLFSIFIFDHLETKIFNWPVESATRNAATLDIYSRTVQNFSQNIDLKEYVYSDKGVSFEGIAVRHYQQCSDSGCFCKSILEQLSNGQGEKSHLRKTFIDMYLLLIFNQFLAKRKINQYNMVRFQYLSLLIDSVRCPLKSNIESIQLGGIKTQSMGFRDRIILNQLRNRAYNLFERNVISIEKQKSQSLSRNYYQTDTDLFDIIRFDMLLSYYQKSTRQIYQLKRDFFNLIACEEVNLIQVKQNGEQILSFLDQIDEIIEELNKINPLSRRCQELTLIYTTIFDMRKKRIRQNVTKQRKSIFHKIVRGDDRALNFFSSKSCCFYVSLLKPVGIIKRCTRTIFNVFGYGQQEVINRSINSLIPDSIASVHDKILENFIREGQTKKIMTSEYFFLGKSANNFIFPLKATMRISHLNDEFGLCCFMERIETSNQFILIDDKLTMAGRRNKIINMSRDLYNQCFSAVYNPNKGDEKLGQIDLYKLIPFMQALDYQDCNELDYYQSIMIYPLNEHHLANMKKRIRISSKNASDLAWYLVFSLASNCGFLDVSFSVKRFKSKLGHNFKYIEIQNMRRVKRRLEKLESLHTLRSDLNQIMKLNVSLDNKTLQKSLGLLSQSLKLSFSSNDFAMLFKRAPSLTGHLNKQENADEQKWILKKKMTIQSLSNKDTTNARSSAGVEFDDEIEGTNKDEDGDTQIQPILKQNYYNQDSKNNSFNLQKNKSINQNNDRSMFNTFNDTYIDNQDVSHLQLKKKSIIDLSSISFQQSRQRNKSISQNNVSNVILANMQQTKNDLNVSQLAYQIDSEQNEIQFNEPIPFQSITQRDFDKNQDASFNINNRNRNLELNNEDTLKNNLKNFDSFNNNHPSQHDSFGDQGRKGNFNQNAIHLEEVIDIAKDRYEQSTSRSQLPWGSATGRDLRDQDQDNEKLYQAQPYSTNRNNYNNALNIEEEAEEQPSTFREVKKQIFYEPSAANKKPRQENSDDDENDSYWQNGNKKNNDNYDNFQTGSNKLTLKQISQDKKSSQYFAFASSSKSTGLYSNQQSDQFNRKEQSPENRQRNESSQMLQSLPQQQQQQQQINLANRQNVHINQINSQEIISYSNLPQEGSSKNHFNFDFEGQIPPICAQESSRFEKSIKQQVFYQGTLSSLTTTVKKSQKTQSTLKQDKVQKKKKKKVRKNKGISQNNEKLIDNNQNDLNQDDQQKKNEEIIDLEKEEHIENDNKQSEGEEDDEEEYEQEEEEDDEEEEEEDENEAAEKNEQAQGSLSDNFNNKKTNNKNANNDKKTPQSFDSENLTAQKNKDMELVDRIDTGMDRSSSTRTRSDMSVKKQIIATVMMKSFESVLVKAIKAIGYLSLLFLIMITIFVFLTITSNLSTMQNNQEVIYLGPGLEEDTSTVIIQNEYRRQNEQNLFVNKIPDSKLEELNKGNDEEFGVIRGRIEFLSDTTLPFANVILNPDDQKVLETYDEEGNVMYKVSSSHFYAIFQSYLGFIEYSYKNDAISRLYVVRNFLEIANIFDDLRESANNVALDSANTTQVVLIYTFAMIIVVAFVTIGMIFPIYRKVQQSKEETLKLFATFPKDKLEQMIIQMERVINSNIFIRNATEREIHLKSNIRWKKRTIASTTRLPKYNFYVTIGCLIAFILISLYPIINYSINNKYIDQLKIFLEELSFIHKARGHSIYAKSLLFMRISAANDNNSQIAQTIDEYYPTLLEKNSEVILELKSMLDNFQDESRYNYDNQKTFVYDSLVSNMCDQFKLFKTLNLQYEKQRDDYLDPTDCTKQFENLLSHGMIIELEKVFEVFNDLFDITKRTQFVSSFQEWDKQHNFNKLDDLQEFQSGGFESIFLYQQSDLKKLFDFLQNLQLTLLIYAICVILLLFIIGWNKFISYVHSEINRTKYLFSLFSIDSLLENNYIATYIKKSSKNK